MQRTLIIDLVGKKNEPVILKGWVSVRRDHGKIIFFDLRDRTGIIQVVCVPSEKEAYAIAETLRPEWVIEIHGVVNERPEKMVNAEIPTGTIELLAKNIIVLNEAKTPPFPIDTDGHDIDEELRLKYRYLDLRRERMRENMKSRHAMNFFIREYLSQKEFQEIETPILTKGTPEGAREYIVPSRLHHGQAFVLPQSPQQFKQILMVSGIERYFQIARCFRDEDERKDRQPEFTQLDIEMSFIDEEDVMALTENLLIALIQKIFPTKKIKEIPFPRISHEEAVVKHQSNKPDMRSGDGPDELAFVWVVDFPLFEKDASGHLASTHHPFTSVKDEDMGMLDSNPEKAKAKAYDIVLNGYEIGGGSIRIHQKDTQEKIFKILGLSEKEIQSKFGHIIEAFEFGAPPHGGIAIGLDRLLAIIRNEPSIREVIAFPKTGDARDPLMGAPSEVPPKQLKELGISFQK